MKKNHETNSQSSRDAVPPPRPIFVGPGNALAMTGHSWRWCRDASRRLGVRVIAVPGSSKSVIVASELLEALAARSAPATPEREPDEYEALCRRVGLRVVRDAQ